MSNRPETLDLTSSYQRIADVVEQAAREVSPEPSVEEIGRIFSVSEGVASVHGLGEVGLEEVVRFADGTAGLTFDLSPEAVQLVLLDSERGLSSGDLVRRTGRVLDVPVGEDLLGRVVDPLGRPRDSGREIEGEDRKPVERPAPAIMDRAPVTVPLQTGIQAIDALIPVGRGQRELIVGDRQTGKTAVAVDTIINQRGNDIVCVYCAVGQRSTAVAQIIDDLKSHDAFDYTVIVVATGEDQPGLNFLAPFAASTIAEHFMYDGADTLVVFDDLTRHARAYRELSLLLRRPPAREAYPGDIFYLHSRLLERATHLSDEMGGGSMTALPIVETEEQNISAYIPTNLISITDGQIYLSPRLFQQGILPAVDVGRSVSRVGGKTQLPAYRTVAGDLRLVYSQFEELENFARFGVQLDRETQRTLERGRTIREVLKQEPFDPLTVIEQIAVLVATTEGLLDDVDSVPRAKRDIRRAVSERSDEPVFQSIDSGEELDDRGFEELISIVREAISGGTT